MVDKNALVEALAKGREIRPTKHHGVLFAGDDKACALGAIAIGLGFPNPTDVSEENDISEREGYEFLHPYLGGYVSRLWTTNDASFEDDKQLRDPDEAVINIIQNIIQ